VAQAGGYDVHELILINACCGGDDGLESYAEFLRRKLDGRARVELLALGSCGDLSAIPAPLIKQLTGQKIDGVPVIVLDGRVLASGPLPSWIDSFEMIEQAMGAQEPASAS
jgi:hypothetical protein